MSVVISYILRLRHDEKDDFLPVEKIAQIWYLTKDFCTLEHNPKDFGWVIFKALCKSVWD